MSSGGPKREDPQGGTAGAEALQAERRRQLQPLLGRLQAELEELSKTHREAAQSIEGFAQAAAHEATRKEQNPRLLNAALEGLKASVEEFEASHPRLVQTVGALAHLLASMGV